MEMKNDWEKAIQNEIKAYEVHETWTPAELPKIEKAIDTRWVFKIKQDGTKKARLVAKGYQEDTLYNDYAPFARMPTIRMMISYALYQNWKVKQLDIPTAFLNGNLDTNVYIKTLKGVTNDTDKVLKLKISLYGLRSAPRKWNERFHNFLEANRLKISTSDFCLYIGDKVSLLIWVDDILITGFREERNKLIELLKQEFKAKDMDDLNYFLGTNITRKDNKIKISQKHFIEQVLIKFNMENCKGTSTPMGPNFQIKIEDRANDNIPFRQLIGPLMYIATVSRPDSIYATSFLSRYLNKPTNQLWKAAKRILRYLKQTKDLVLTYKQSSNCQLTAYSDADWAGDKVDRKNGSGLML